MGWVGVGQSCIREQNGFVTHSRRGCWRRERNEDKGDKGDGVYIPGRGREEEEEAAEVVVGPSGTPPPPGWMDGYGMGSGGLTNRSRAPQGGPHAPLRTYPSGWSHEMPSGNLERGYPTA